MPFYFTQHVYVFTLNILESSINQSIKKVLFNIKLYIRIIGVVHVCCNVSGDPR